MIETTANPRRFVGLGSDPTATVRLFCFPFAGGGASAFRDWRASQAPDLEVVAVELPGREKRIGEPPFRDLTALVRDVAAILPVDRRFAFFGHSMGGLIIYELARALAARGVAPSHLFVSAFRAPHLPKRGKLKHLLSDEELTEEVRTMGGTPPELLENAELLAMLLPVLRADLALVETYAYVDGPPPPCPVTVFGGHDDEDVTEAELRPWRLHTRDRFRLEMLAGDHFYLYGARARLLDAIRCDLGLRPLVTEHT